MDFSMEQIPSIVEVAALSQACRLKDIEKLCNIAKAYNCAATNVHPCFLTYTLKNTLGYEGIKKCVSISYPLGSDLTSVKVYSAKQTEIMGAEEIDLVINMNAFLSGNLAYVKQEIDAVCDCVKLPVTVIIEAAQMNESEISTAAKLVSKTKAAYLKNSTGFFETQLSANTFSILKESLSEVVQLKAAGQVAGIDELLQIAELGVQRFSMDANAASALFKKLDRELGRKTATVL